VTDSAPPSRWRLWLALLALAMPVQMTVTASPFLNGAAMDARHLDTSGIGAIRTAEILTNACLMIWLSANITRFRLRSLGLTGVCLFLLGNLTCLLTDSVAGLAAGRILAGAGAGAMAATLGALIAQARSPHRVASLIAIPVTLAAIVTALGVGRLAETAAELGVFGFLCAGAALGVVLFLIAAPDGKPHAAHAPQITSLAGALRSPYVLGSATIFFGSTAVWHFFERIGVGLDFSPRQIGELSAGVAIMCGLFAPVAALVRDGWVRWAFLGAVLTFGVGSAMIPLSTNATMYGGAFAMQSVGFTLAQILGAAVASRRGGRPLCAALGALRGGIGGDAELLLHRDPQPAARAHLLTFQPFSPRRIWDMGEG
jgi:MFS family permease